MSTVPAPRIDMTAMSCLDQCKALYNAYLRMLAGGQKVQVRYESYWVEYRQNTAGDMDRLRKSYNTLREQCAAAMEELPSLEAAEVRRGPPGRVFV